MTKEYLSPVRKLLPFFANSRDSWKEKCKAAKKEIKVFKNHLTYLKQRNKELKQQNKALKEKLALLSESEKKDCNTYNQPQEKGLMTQHQSQQLNMDLFDENIPRHKYSLGHINLMINLLLTAVSMRCASRVLEIIKSFFKIELTIPCWYTGRLWLLKLGYYKLTRTKEHAEDWVWIIDHSIQLGADKCFVILGVRASKLSENKRLTLKDVEPIELLPVKKSNGEIVYEQLQNAINKTGVPRAIVGDEGSDLRAGATKFCDTYRTTAYIHDIKHKVALALKKEFENDKAWSCFLEFVSTAQGYVQQTELASLAPPNQRSKARYMNVDKLVSWGKQVLTVVENNEQNPMIENNSLLAKFGWLKYYKKDLESWNNIVDVAIYIEDFVKNKGIFRGITSKLRYQLDNTSINNRTEQFKENLLSSLLMEEGKVHIGETLIGSSEIIESRVQK